MERPVAVRMLRLMMVIITSRLLLVLLMACAATHTRAQDDDEGGAAELGDGEGDSPDGPKPPVAILEHRQEVADDGSFNYAFTADNGLQQNEMFHPDGSRTGSYSYVDPRGETVMVKYRADRFGFHVLDGSSIPSTPPQHAETQQKQTMVRPTGDYVRPQESQEDSGDFSGGFTFSGKEGASSLRELPIGSAGQRATAQSSNSPVAMALQQGLYQRAMVPLSKQAARARTSQSQSMHFLQREARHAFYSDLDSEQAPSQVLPRYLAPQSSQDQPKFSAPQGLPKFSAPQGLPKFSAPQGLPKYSTPQGHPNKYSAPQGKSHHAARTRPSYGVNDVAASADIHHQASLDGEGQATEDDGRYELHAAKYDDGSYEPHAAKYDDGSYEKHARLYDDGSYEPHAAKYDDGSYEPHAAKYDDGRYRQHKKGGYGGNAEEGDRDEYF